MAKKKTFDDLRKLEAKINRAYYNCKNVEFFFETNPGYNYARRWEAMMLELRGWVEYRFDDAGKDLTKSTWIEYCGTRLSVNYNIGDVCA